MPSMPSRRRIDFHVHLIPKFYEDAAYEAGAGPAIGRYPAWSPELALDLMDKAGIDVALMSLAQPGVQFGDPTKAVALARRCNEYSAELNVRWPNRFGAFAVIPMWDVPGAVAEIEHAVHHRAAAQQDFGIEARLAVVIRVGRVDARRAQRQQPPDVFGRDKVPRRTQDVCPQDQTFVESVLGVTVMAPGSA